MFFLNWGIRLPAWEPGACGRFCFSCEGPNIISAVAPNGVSSPGNNELRGVGEMSGSRKRVEQNKQRRIDTATRIPQANELLLLVSVFTCTIVITLLKRAGVPAERHTHDDAAALSQQLPWQQKKLESRSCEQNQGEVRIRAVHCFYSFARIF